MVLGGSKSNPHWDSLYLMDNASYQHFFITPLLMEFLSITIMLIHKDGSLIKIDIYWNKISLGKFKANFLGTLISDN
jgi:hypothetical protein